ncbi:hypothetical protein BCR34DRAFT_157630 [Clohesyomyces aquaticus]|uniref:Uncharacterized protein n=1 Tax=Clohesyomyces aquaticus TaxID=1231657 RepID=A0A1Y1YJ66_9PLEO|nr:hypothetical protein BCR34DRAFT_157630 [Clohesyomyces aquaticus]
MEIAAHVVQASDMAWQGNGPSSSDIPDVAQPRVKHCISLSLSLSPSKARDSGGSTGFPGPFDDDGIYRRAVPAVKNAHGQCFWPLAAVHCKQARMPFLEMALRPFIRSLLRCSFVFAQYPSCLSWWGLQLNLRASRFPPLVSRLVPLFDRGRHALLPSDSHGGSEASRQLLLPGLHGKPVGVTLRQPQPHHEWRWVAS